VKKLGVLSEADVDEAYLQCSNAFSGDIWDDIDSRHLRYSSDGFRHFCKVINSDGVLDSVLPISFQNDFELSVIVDRRNETCSFLWNDRVKYIYFTFRL